MNQAGWQKRAANSVCPQWFMVPLHRYTVVFLAFSGHTGFPRTVVNSDWLLYGRLSIEETVERVLRLIGSFGMSEMCGQHCPGAGNLHSSENKITNAGGRWRRLLTQTCFNFIWLMPVWVGCQLWAYSIYKCVFLWQRVCVLLLMHKSVWGSVL